MPRKDMNERVKKGLFLLDGALGTQLFARGIEAGSCNDYLNIDSQDIVSDIHLAYLEAGCDAITTNTFGANQFTLARHGLEKEVIKINKAGAQLARQAAGQEKYVLGDIGPSGDFLEPLGTLKPDMLRNAFALQAKGLIDGGVDGFIIETMTAIDEITIAIEAIKSASDNMPIFASMSFDRAGDDFRTMMGVAVETTTTKIIPFGIDAIGFNCGTISLDEYVELAGKFVSAVRALSDDVLVCAQPNAGKPELVEGLTVYKVSPEDFAEAIKKIHSTGVNIIGGCCGTSPEHLQAVAKLIKNNQ